MVEIVDDRVAAIDVDKKVIAVAASRVSGRTARSADPQGQHLSPEAGRGWWPG